jgi:hypothetical protein
MINSLNQNYSQFDRALLAGSPVGDTYGEEAFETESPLESAAGSLDAAEVEAPPERAGTARPEKRTDALNPEQLEFFKNMQDANSRLDKINWVFNQAQSRVKPDNPSPTSRDPQDETIYSYLPPKDGRQARVKGFRANEKGERTRIIITQAPELKSKGGMGYHVTESNANSRRCISYELSESPETGASFRLI